MGILERLKGKFIEAEKRPRPRATGADPVGMKRKKFSAYLVKQKSLIDSPQPTAKKKGRSPKKDFWQNQEGTYIFAPRYGSSSVVILEGKPHIAAGKKIEDLQALIEDLIK